MKPKEFCTHCGASMVKYKFRINWGMAGALIKLQRMGRPCSMGELGLTPSQYTNFAKVAYWNLANNEGGQWSLTRDGERFLEGYPIQDTVETYRGEVTQYLGKAVTIGQLRIEYKKRLDYIKDREPVTRLERGLK